MQSVLAAMNCTHSDEKAWYLVLASIDRRQAACVRQNVNWEKLSDGWQAEKVEAERLKMVNAGMGTFAYLRKMKELPVKIRSDGGFENFCSSVPWKMLLLAPEKTTTEEKSAFVRSHPGIDINATIDVVATIRGLGLSREWIDTSCEKGFWPVTFR